MQQNGWALKYAAEPLKADRGIVLAAVKQGTWIDHTCRIVTTAGVSLPVFFTGLLFAYVFYYLLQWAPAPTGRLDAFLSPPTLLMYEAWYLKISTGSTGWSLTPQLSGNKGWSRLKLLRPGAERQGTGPSERAAMLTEPRRLRPRRR